jgi:phage protein D
VRPAFRVTVDGEDVTSAFVPRLVSLSLSDAAGVQSDRVSFRLSDTEPMGRLQEPGFGAEVRVWLGYGSELRYMGLFIADRVEVSGPPDEMSITAVASPHGETSGGKSAITAQATRSVEAGTTLGDLVAQIASRHGMAPAVSPALASIELPHIDQVDESDINLLTRLALDLDAIAKPGDGKLVLARRGESLSVGGRPMPVLQLYPEDVSQWRAGRSLREPAGRVLATHQDLDAGQPVEAVAGDLEPIIRLRPRFPTKDAADRAAASELARRSRAGRSLSLQMPGDPDLVAESRLRLTGFRSYVDGEWLVTSVQHSLDSGGYRCSVTAETMK